MNIFNKNIDPEIVTYADVSIFENLYIKSLKFADPADKKENPIINIDVDDGIIAVESLKYIDHVTIQNDILFGMLDNTRGIEFKNMNVYIREFFDVIDLKNKVIRCDEFEAQLKNVAMLKNATIEVDGSAFISSDCPEMPHIENLNIEILPNTHEWVEVSLDGIHGYDLKQIKINNRSNTRLEITVEDYYTIETALGLPKTIYVDEEPVVITNVDDLIKCVSKNFENKALNIDSLFDNAYDSNAFGLDTFNLGINFDLILDMWDNKDNHVELHIFNKGQKIDWMNKNARHIMVAEGGSKQYTTVLFYRNRF